MLLDVRIEECFCVQDVVSCKMFGFNWSETLLNVKDMKIEM